LHRNYKKSNNQSFINLYIPQFIPHINEGDFLREELNLEESLMAKKRKTTKCRYGKKKSGACKKKPGKKKR